MIDNITFDLHTHTRYSDGKSTVLENAAATSAGNWRLGISDHGPGHVFYGISNKDLASQRAELDAVRFTPGGKNILQGVEANLMDVGKTDIDRIEHPLDFYLLGYHKGTFPRSMLAVSLFSARIVKKQRADVLMTDALIASIQNDQRILLITHPGEYVPVCMSPLAEATAKSGVLLEINERHPLSIDQAKTALHAGASFLLSSDAHRSSQIGKVNSAWNTARAADITNDRIVNSADYPWDNAHLRIKSLKEWASDKY